MLREQARQFSKVAMVMDALMVLLSFRVAYQLRTEWGLPLHEINDYYWIFLFIFPAGYYLFTHYDLYSSLRTRPLPEILFSLLKVHLFGGIIIAAVIYLVEPQGVSRWLFSLFLVFSYLFLAVEKITVKLLLGCLRSRGLNLRYMLIAGTGKKSEKFARYVHDHAEWGLRIKGFLMGEGDTPKESIHGYPVLGLLENLVDVCKADTIDEVVFCLENESVAKIEHYLEELEELGITVRMALDFYELQQSKREVSLLHGEIPIMTFHRKGFDANMLLLKRCLDVAGALVGLTITAGLSPFIALAIRIESPGPILFGQKRVGQNGRLFTCWKFRSMFADAEERKRELMTRNEVRGAMFKMKDDPRVTKVGKFLRKASLDELPQFWNVLYGEMSLVGTRPPTPDEVARYENWQRRRISIKPGVTGLWQVSGRNQIKDFDEIVRLDLQYIDNWSLLFDIRIILRTVKVVFLREGSQ
jgi:exopolysaccharide biosynthesis polyprenyl glycosylphosphotransferase